MASTYTPLGIELMATGENAGTWGTKTNANLNLFEQLSGGFKALSIAGGAQTTALTVADGALTGTAQARMIEFTGTITGNQIVTIPLDVETPVKGTPISSVIDPTEELAPTPVILNTCASLV